MEALELEEEEDEEHDQLLLDDRTVARICNNSSSIGSSSRRRSGSPDTLLPSLRTSHHTMMSLHHQSSSSSSSSSHQQQRRQQRQYCVMLFILFIPAALLFIAARNRDSYSSSSNSMLINSSSSSYVTKNAIDDDHDDQNPSYHSLPPPPPLFNHTFATYLTSGLQQILAANHGITKHYIYDSPYEHRFPQSKQPYWARKTIPYNKRIKKEQQICLVHVGKAGGSTLGCMLGFSLHCENNDDDDGDDDATNAIHNTTNDSKDEDDVDDDDDEHDDDDDDDEKKKKKERMVKLHIKGLLPIATTHVFHRGVNDCADVAAYYLFVVRDPLARILSAFNYERPNMTKTVGRYKNEFMGEELYEECEFWTLEQLAQGGLLNRKEDDSSMRCQSRVYKAITGVGGYLCHGYFNYQYYAQSVFGTQDAAEGESVVPKNANLLVIRNDHIVDDWNTINLMIGGEPEDAIQSSDIPMNNAHAKNATEMFLSDSSKDILCHVLCNEIQVYKDIIRRAVNLNREDVTNSIEDLRKTCPTEAMMDTCSEERPNFRNRIERMRGG